MKRLIILFALTLLCACTSKTEFGNCVGAFDDKDPKLTYKLSGKNVFLGVVGSELMLIPPIVVLVNETFCPVGAK